MAPGSRFLSVAGRLTALLGVCGLLGGCGDPCATIGAICLACAPVTEDRPALFRKLLVWGWSMAVVGAVVCQVLFGFR